MENLTDTGRLLRQLWQNTIVGELNSNNYSQRRRSPIIPSKRELSVLNPSTSVFFGVFDVPPLQTCGDWCASLGGFFLK